MNQKTQQCRIVLRGSIPSKKNSKRAVYAGGRLLFIPSVRHKEWHEDALWQIQKQKVKPVDKVLSVEIEFYAPDKRKTDLTNKAESIMDLLVDAGIIKDDNWFEVPAISLVFLGVDKENPRAEIQIYF